MKVLIVGSGNSIYGISPFIKEQGDSLKVMGIEINYFLIEGRGIFGYLRNLPRLIKKIKRERYNLIHAHYGLSGLLCVLQRKVPVIITFHGSDINSSHHKYFSKIAMYMSAYSIFVHESIKDKIKAKNRYSILPCGINLQIFFPMERQKARKIFGIPLDKKMILFSSAFDISVKNFPLAQKAVEILNAYEIELVELKGYTPEQVNVLVNAADLVLVTSFSETGPLIVKEAMACNIPIVSTDVGDAKEVIGKTKGCYITTFEPEDVADKIKKAMGFGKRTTGRENIKYLESSVIAKQIIDIYKRLLNEK